MSQFAVNPHRLDPYKSFKFRVQWEGKVIAGVSKVSALQRKTEAVVHRDGGDPSQSNIAPGTTRFEPITLERGLTHDSEFEDWASKVFNFDGDAAMSLKEYRKDIRIELLNLQGKVVMAFQVYRCWVAEYQALPALDSNQNAVAIERLVLEHEGWERDESVTEPVET